jgi:hypothetical protein
VPIEEEEEVCEISDHLTPLVIQLWHFVWSTFTPCDAKHPIDTM